jgi:hypothetical protein
MSILHKTIKEILMQRDSARDKLIKGNFHDYPTAMALVERSKAFDQAAEIVKDNDKFNEDEDG